MRRFTQIFAAMGAWLAGLVIASQWILALNLLAMSLLAALSLTALWIVRSKLGYILVFVAFVSLGMVRGQLYFAQQERWSVENLLGEKVELVGRVTGEPSCNADRLHEFYIDGITLNGRPVPGMMKIKSLVGSSQEGQVVRVVGKVGHALGRAPTQIWYAKVETIDRNIPYPIRLKNLLGHGLAAALPREEAGFVRGLLFGTSAAVSTPLEANLRAVGLTHIIAVSGYNLTIIVAALTVFSRRRSRNSLLLALAGIGFFIIMTGAPASIVRAGVMAGIFLLVSYYRRELDPRIALAATVVAMSAWNPMYIYVDIGWQLSVLAWAGVLWLAPGFRPKTITRHGMFWEVFSTAIGAYLATAPILAYYFGTVSFIAPLANIFILPVVPVIMLLGFVAALVGVLVPSTAFVLMQPVAWVVSLVVRMITAFAHVPHASEHFVLDASVVLTTYIGLLVIAFVMMRRGSKMIAKRL